MAKRVTDHADTIRRALDGTYVPHSDRDAALDRIQEVSEAALVRLGERP